MQAFPQVLKSYGSLSLGLWKLIRGPLHWLKSSGSLSVGLCMGFLEAYPWASAWIEVLWKLIHGPLQVLCMAEVLWKIEVLWKLILGPVG